MLSEKVRNPPATQSRKMTKSVMEKKRRARINTSLSELKSILGGIVTHRGERFDKMEKADILEMTVNYVKQLQSGLSKDSRSKTSDDDYKNGVNSCISEVIKYVASNDLCDTDVKTKLLDHLADKITGNKVPSPDPVCFQPEPVVSSTIVSPVSSETPAQSVDLDCNNNVQIVQQNLPDSSTSTEQVSPTTFTVSSSTAPALQSSFMPVRPLPIMPAVCQAPTVLSNIPLAIVVPANLYSPSSSGTTCVFAIPSNSSQHNIVTTGSPSMEIQKDNGVPHLIAPSIISPQLVQSSTCQQSLSPDSNTSPDIKVVPTETSLTNLPVTCSPLYRLAQDVSEQERGDTPRGLWCPTVLTSRQSEAVTSENVSPPPKSLTNNDIQMSTVDKGSENETNVQYDSPDFTPTFHKKYRRHLADAKKSVWRPW